MYMYVCVCVYIYIYIDIHTYTHTYNDYSSCMLVYIGAELKDHISHGALAIISPTINSKHNSGFQSTTLDFKRNAEFYPSGNIRS